ncbi:hypothetical protein Pla163_25850 [Planctomycetes bacterium Pla163]|uniref:Uncharacterized protein n=1 Tax=Rohdeia mirabilis TaxID=2528008 RepID=A0A518D1Z1_9BACT|nr:hypothetical protein Pla163_25850 [Planctomycetes bacterium Pla163]
MFDAPLLAQGEQDPLKLLFQLIVLAIFFAGPLLGRVLKKMASGDKGAGGAKPKAARPSRTDSRADSRSEAEELGGDLWRQLMELEKVPELEEIDAPPVAKRRPADPLNDPDIEIVQDSALERRRAEARPRTPAAPPQAPPPPRLPKRAPVSGGPATGAPVEGGAGTYASDVPLTKGRRIESFKPTLSEVPTEEQLERMALGNRPSHAPIPGGGFSSSALPSMGGVSEAAREVTVVGRAGTATGGLTPADLRRAVLLSEILGPPVSERRNGWGDRDSLWT